MQPSFPGHLHPVDRRERVVQHIPADLLVPALDRAPPGRDLAVARRHPLHRRGVERQQVAHPRVLVLLAPVRDAGLAVRVRLHLARVPPAVEERDAKVHGRAVQIPCGDLAGGFPGEFGAEAEGNIQLEGGWGGRCRRGVVVDGSRRESDGEVWYRCDRVTGTEIGFWLQGRFWRWRAFGELPFWEEADQLVGGVRFSTDRTRNAHARAREDDARALGAEDMAALCAHHLLLVQRVEAYSADECR